MSGGAFEYKEYQLDYLADDIEHVTEGYINAPDLQKHAKRLATRLRKLRKEIKQLDYYISGDCSVYK